MQLRDDLGAKKGGFSREKTTVPVSREFRRSLEMGIAKIDRIQSKTTPVSAQ